MRLFLAALIMPAVLGAQAAVEYALRSAGSALRGPFHLGVCQIDSSFVSCMNSHYPAAIPFVLIVLAIVIWLLWSPRRVH